MKKKSIIIKANSKGELVFPMLEFFTEIDAQKIRQYSLEFRSSKNAYIIFYNDKGKVIKPRRK